MYYPSQPQTSASPSVSTKLHDGNSGPNGDLGFGGRGSGMGGGGWPRNPSAFTPSGMPLPSPSGYQGSNSVLGGGGYNGPPPGNQHHPSHGHVHSQHGGHGLHQHQQQQQQQQQHHTQHPHHPSFGNGAVGNGGNGLHLTQQGTGGLGMGGTHGPGQYGGGLGMMGGIGQGQGHGGSPPRSETMVPMTVHWQEQLKKAEGKISRLAASPHHRARAAAMESRADSKRSAVPILDPVSFRPRSSNSNATNAVHRKTTSLSVVQATGRSDTPPPGEPGPTTGASSANGELEVPVPKEDETASEPWAGMDLGGIKLRVLSPALFTFTHLTSLYINHNSLTSIPPAISRLRHLTVLDATGNELTSIPPEMGLLHNLKDLLLFDNHLTTLPSELGTLYQLTTLGIDGNPMDDRFRKMLAEEGTAALITHLRDTAAVGPSPPDRQWVVIDSNFPSPSSGKQETFTVLSYNILCAQFAQPWMYAYTPNWALDWSYRKQTILQEIINASADIVCLQEVDCGQYEVFFAPELKAHGYEGSHYPRSRARTMGSDEGKLVDGCATFWKADKFKLVETQVVEFNQVALRASDIRTEDMFNRVMARDNIAVICALEFVASGARLLVGNSHIFWDHRYRDVKLVQIGMLMEELEKIVEQFSAYPAKRDVDLEFNNGKGAPKYDRDLKGTDIPLILCTDLNSLQGSAVYDFLSTGELAPDHEDFMSHGYGKYTNRGLSHRLGLRSSCASFGEMRMTNFTPTFEGAIDWIFYSHKSLVVTSVLGDVDRDYLDKTVGFPNAHFPSDHIPVYAQFRVKPQIDHQPVQPVVHSSYGNY